VLMLYQKLGENQFQTSTIDRSILRELTADSAVHEMTETAQALLRCAQAEFRAGEPLVAPLVRFNQTNEVTQALWQTHAERSHFGYDRLGINFIKGALIIALDSRRLDLPARITIGVDSLDLTAEEALNSDPQALRPQVSNVSWNGQDKFARQRQRGPDDGDAKFKLDVILGDEDITQFMTRFYDITAIHGLNGLRHSSEELRLAS
jgi:hypothetical protein